MFCLVLSCLDSCLLKTLIFSIMNYVGITEHVEAHLNILTERKLNLIK